MAPRSTCFWLQLVCFFLAASAIEGSATCQRECNADAASWDDKCERPECASCPACSADGAAQDPQSIRIHGEDQFGKLEAMTEADRQAAWRKLYGVWPLPKWSREEYPSLTVSMAEREKEAMAQTDRGGRWGKFMDICQSRAVSNFTERQSDVVQMPKNVHERLMKVLHGALATAQAESGGFGVGGRSLKIDNERMNYEILKELQPMHEEWAGVPLEPTAAYGIRIYEHGSTMSDHVDILETHVISSVVHIDSDIDEDFPIEVQDVHGVYQPANLKPGEMVFYESAKCFHRRPTPMKGRFHANLFLHYRPKGWLKQSLTRDVIRLMVPPHWEEGSTASPVAAKAVEQDVKIKFTYSASAAVPAIIYWLNNQGQWQEVGQVAPGKDIAFNTKVGYRWSARPMGEERELKQWTIHEGFNDEDIPWTASDEL